MFNFVVRLNLSSWGGIDAREHYTSYDYQSVNGLGQCMAQMIAAQRYNE